MLGRKLFIAFLSGIWLLLVGCRDDVPVTHNIVKRGSGDSHVSGTKEVTVQPLGVNIRTASTQLAEAPIKATVEIKNLSGKPLLVNRRLLLNHRISEGELFFDIENQSGSKYDLQALIDPRDLGPDDFVLLPADQALMKTIDLTDRYGIRKRGHYRLIVTYRNQTAWRSESGIEAWTGTVQSSPIEIEIR